MVKYGKKLIALMTACVLLSGCSQQNAKQNESGGQDSQTEGIVQKVTTITEVFGDGEKPSAVAIEYPAEIDASSLSLDDFEVENQTITGIYTNSEAAITESNVAGNYVILKLAYENTDSFGTMDGNGQGRNGELNGEMKSAGEAEADGGMKSDRGADGDGGMKSDRGADGDGGMKSDRGADDDGSMKPDRGDMVDGGMLRGDAGADGDHGNEQERQSEDNLSVSVVQKGEVAGTDGTIYPASDTVMESSELIELVLQDFEQFEYTDPETGATIPYSLFLPEDYDESKEYPLLFFVADASANGDDLTRNLTQGNGAIIFATPEEQAKHECIVVSPQYTNTLIDSIGALTTDDNVWSDGLTLVSNLLHYVIEEYSVDENRIYGTGQSQGCMTNIAISDKYPDLFAAQLLVAGQWNVEEMSAMKDKNLWIVVCEGDAKAYPGMNEATANWEALGSSVARSEMWDSTSTPEQFDELVEQMESQGCKINYTVFEGGSHTYTWSVAYNIEGIRDWLFAQTKE